MALKPTQSAGQTVPVVTKEEIAKLKTKHGKVFSYTTKDGKVAYFRKPTRQIIAAAAVIANGDQLKYRESIARSCIIGGDQEIIDNDDYFFTMQQQIEAMITVVEGELKEV